jgi:hypothetical protein
MKPVAWSCWNEGMPCAVILVTEPDMYEWQSIEPLYTSPRELSDEEIIEVFESPFQPNTTGKINDEVIAFARAILKKASEK